MSHSAGLKFKKFDLHIHTPASDDFKDKSATVDDIVNEALKKGLAGIAITDHQTAAGIDGIKKAANGKGLAVFPGVELMVTGGKHGIHLIVLFDIDKDTRHIDQFLNTVNIYKKKGEKVIAADKTVGQIADALEKYDPSAILILAHSTSSKGATGGIQGETRKLIFEPHRKSLLGAEASEADFLDEVKKKSHTRLVDCLDGTDANYHNRKLGVYQSSDAHSVAQIGSVFTYFKVDESVCIEDIRQSLIDRDTRIRQVFEYKEEIYPRISHMKVTSGFLSDQEIEFHEGLNSILGAKGSGKSLAIEFLRFVLNQQPKNEELLDDHNAKLEKCLKLHGDIEVTYVDESGKVYKVKRTYNTADGHPIEIWDMDDNIKKEFAVEQVFPVLFLSQNEIIRIAEDKTGASQREFIDRFFDFYKYQQNIEIINRELKQIDGKFSEAIRAHLRSVETQKKVATCKEEIEKLSKQITNRVFDKYSKKEKIGQAIKNQIEFLGSIQESLESNTLGYKDLVPPASTDEETNSDPAVKRAVDIIKTVIAQINENFSSTLSELKTRKAILVKEYDDWKAGFSAIKTEYDKVIQDAGGNQLSLDQRRKNLIIELSKLEQALAKYQGSAQQVKAITVRRDETIKRLNDAYKAYFEERKKRCEYFTQSSLGALDVSIKEQEDATNFKNNLLELRKRSWVREDDIDLISKKISPRDFIENLLRYEWSGRTKKDSIEEIATKTSIKSENVEKLAQHLLNEYEYTEILALYYNSVPKDVPLISYKVGSTFKSLNELSIGQKATALLMIALSDGVFPIVIDQPEDSLDIRTIWDDLCQKLRSSKESRQFIFTTHNSSVAVASDTDKFTILEADADHGKVLYSGSINRGVIRKEVIDYLEGGKPTYGQKRRKYNID